MVTLPPGEDSTGECLSALRFASRASKVKVVAKISRFQDYEAMYKSALEKLKALETAGDSSSSKGHSEVGGRDQSIVHEQRKEIESLQSLLTNKEEKIDQQQMEIEQLKQQIKILQQAAISREPAHQTTSSTYSSSFVDIEAALENAKLEHHEAMEDMKKTLHAKLSASKATERKATTELMDLRDELSKEKAKRLTAMQELRELHEKHFRTEEELKERIVELLSELAERREEVADLEARCEQRDQIIIELQEKLSDSVTREQVQEMENLFLETVTNLSNRVNTLESSQPSASSAGTNSAVRGNVRLEPGGRVRANQGQPSGTGASSMKHSNSAGTVRPVQDQRQQQQQQQKPSGKLW